MDNLVLAELSNVGTLNIDEHLPPPHTLEDSYCINHVSAKSVSPLLDAA